MYLKFTPGNNIKPPKTASTNNLYSLTTASDDCREILKFNAIQKLQK